MRAKLRAIPSLLLAGVSLLPLGCHSAFIDATVSNQSGGPVRLIEVDYPSASFGTEDLAAGKTFKYHFKVQGDGDTKLSWTDAARKDHTCKGPALQEGQMGTLTIVIGASGADWHTSLTH